jgi:hypothetical protein
MAAIDIGWTPSALRDVGMALEATLGRVPEGAVSQTAIADNWRKAHDWVQAVQQIIPQPDGTIRPEEVPPFPLTSQELRALQTSIDRIAQAHAAASPTHAGPTARHVRQSYGGLRSSAFALGVLIAVSAAITAVDALYFAAGDRPWYFAIISLICAIVVPIFWALHFWRLGAHGAVIKEAHPLS